MKVTLFMATTPNGIIARENYEEDFLSEENWKTFCDLLKESDCLIWGRITYEKVMNWGNKYVKDLDGTNIIVVSSNTKLKLKSGTYVESSPRKAIMKAKSLGFNNVILSGGGKINSEFMKTELIDEIILNIEPIVLGKGIKLFAETDFETKLKLIDTKKITSDIIQLRYKVSKKA